MKTNKINVVLSLNKQTVAKLSDTNDGGAGIPGPFISWLQGAFGGSGFCRVKKSKHLNAVQEDIYAATGNCP